MGGFRATLLDCAILLACSISFALLVQGFRTKSVLAVPLFDPTSNAVGPVSARGRGPGGGEGGGEDGGGVLIFLPFMALAGLSPCDSKETHVNL